MAQQTAVTDEPRCSAVYLAVYRREREEGVLVRTSDAGFHMRHFGGGVRICDAAEVHVAALADAVAVLWAAVNVLDRPNGVDVAYVRDDAALTAVSAAPTVYKVTTTAAETRDVVVAQLTPLLETLGSVRMR